MPPQPDLSAHLRKLKGAQPELTWREIASRLGVSERAVAEWTRGGGISYENARGLAELFEVPVTTFWIIDEAAPSQLDRVEAKLDRVLALLDGAEEPAAGAFLRAAEAVGHEEPATAGGSAPARTPRGQGREAS